MDNELTSIKEQGTCAKCKSIDINYGDTEIDGNGLAYEIICNACNAISLEWYTLTYDETIWQE